MSVSKIRKWLKIQGLETYADRFEKNKISIRTLKNISEADLISLGIHGIGDRKKIINSVKEIEKKEKATAYIGILMAILYIWVSFFNFFDFSKFNSQLSTPSSQIEIFSNLPNIFKNGISDIEYLYIYPILILLGGTLNLLTYVSILIINSIKKVLMILALVIILGLAIFIKIVLGFNKDNFSYFEFALPGLYFYFFVMVIDFTSQITFYSTFDNDEIFQQKDNQISESGIVKIDKENNVKKYNIYYAFQNNEIEKVFDIVNDHYQSNNVPVTPEWLILQSRWKEVNHKKNMGLVPYSDDSEVNKIKYGIISYINEIF